MCVYLFTSILEPDDSDDCVERHVNVDGSATTRLSNSRSALGATRSTWALRDHRIAIIHRHVILRIFILLWPESLCEMKPIGMVRVCQIGWILIGMSYKPFGGSLL